ncbi:sugar phosphate isomerase/epimerase family protein [Sphingobium sp. HBC34]|uniref:Sugar phosphate isomerase/epimerase family protein n=1 Tax=Sphingobium cyanobacteriorum TaxID=3063954 RepID=A0ABT8ZR12_9SPHN|nr:sugar phosphate isomerase/epimerase family protein [Sphingobium sp. HBC34]MDO7836631.1 sugar phosphate isomerase/epimerase family protein [Sphingobium sp. HBC34]
MKGPAIFLAQFAGAQAPFNTLDAITRYMGGLGYKGVQLPTWDSRLIDLALAAESQDYVDELKGICAENGVEVTELSTHLQGQLVAAHPAYDVLLDGFAPPVLHNNPVARTEWAVEQTKLAAKASRRFGCTAHATFSGALMWHMVYPWPQRPAGLVEEGFAELARRWRPILDVFDDNGVDVAYELHPGEDLHDGVTFERFLAAVDNHPRANILYDPSHFLLQQLDYLQFIDFYHDRIKCFHVKDAEFRPNGRAGVYGSYSGWTERPGRFRSLGDGQVDFTGIFTRLTHHGYDGWAVLEWECAYKHPEQGAAEGAPFITRHMIRKAEKAFDDFAGTETDRGVLHKLLGIGG